MRIDTTRAGIILTLLTLMAIPLQAAGTVIGPGDQAPDTRGWDHNRELHVVDFSQAEVTLINFWATWCEPCRNEMPALQQAHEDLGPRGLQVVGITHENIEDAELGTFLGEIGVTYPVFRAGSTIRKHWPGSAGSLPNSYLVGKDGRVIRRYVGASSEQVEQLKSDLVAALEGRPLGPLILPSVGDFATAADRVRQEKEEEARKAAEPDTPD
jgi:thiol-disulfide isomerase/thioredoxin